MTNDSLLVGRFNGTLRALGGKQSVANSVKNDVTIRKVSVISIDTVLETPSSLNVELLHYPFTRNTSMVIDKQLLGSSFTLLLPPNGTFRALEKKICNTGTFYPQDITYLVKALSLNETLAVPADLYESSFSSTNISTIGNYTIQFQSNLNQTLFGVNGSFAGIISDSNHLVQGGIIHYLANFTFPGLRKQDLKCSNSSSLQF